MALSQLQLSNTLVQFMFGDFLLLSSRSSAEAALLLLSSGTHRVEIKKERERCKETSEVELMTP